MHGVANLDSQESPKAFMKASLPLEYISMDKYLLYTQKKN